MADSPFPAHELLPSLTAWLSVGTTPVIWIVGARSTGKTTLVRAALDGSESVLLLPLSAASPDRCLQEAFGTRTTAGLSASLSTGSVRVLALDAIDALQTPYGAEQAKVWDLRMRHVLTSIAHQRWASVRTIVTSRLPPPDDLPAVAVTVLEARHERALPDLAPLTDVGLPRVLEVLASSRKASGGWFLGLLAGLSSGGRSLVTPPEIRTALDRLVGAGIVARIDLQGGDDWYQMVDAARARFLPPEGATAVHSLVAEELEGARVASCLELAMQGSPVLRYDLLERAIEHRVAAGQMREAIDCYWNRLGNYTLLRSTKSSHLGERVCRTLNEQRLPDEISPKLKGCPGDFVVVNDWGVHASTLGNARLAAQAGTAAYSLAGLETKPWDKSTLARHVSAALAQMGRLREAMEWASRAERHGREGLRLQQGIPTEENMFAVDEALGAIVDVAVAAGNTKGAAEALDCWVDIQDHVRDNLAEFNRFSVLPVGGPKGKAQPTELLAGRPAAALALASGRPNEAIKMLKHTVAGGSETWLSSSPGLALRVLLVRALMAEGRSEEAENLAAQLRGPVDELDDAAARCELAAMDADLALRKGGAARALAVTEEHLDLAGACGLQPVEGRLWQVHSRASNALGRDTDAKAAGEKVQEPEAVEVTLPMHKHVAAKQVGRPKQSEAERRAQLNEAAGEVVESYTRGGVPFVLYLRKYAIVVDHGPMEYGPQLTENVLEAALTHGAHVVAIQAHSDPGYSGNESRLDRSAPAFYVDDQHWQEIFRWLMIHADVIVSECLMLSEGVSYELQQLHQLGLFDRTVLLLPPLQSPLAVIDNDPLVQMFPRCIWADSLHNESIVDSFVIQDLLDRLRRIASLPEADRARLVDVRLRNAAYPIDLLPIAQRYETEAEIGSRYQEQDERLRYYGFWQSFRAAAIRGLALAKGDVSPTNRRALYWSYLRMSATMLASEKREGKFVLVGDLAFAEQCIESALAMVRPGDPEEEHYEGLASKALESVLALRRAVEADSDRFIVLPRFGPFTTSRRKASDLMPDSPAES